MSNRQNTKPQINRAGTGQSTAGRKSGSRPKQRTITRAEPVKRTITRKEPVRGAVRADAPEFSSLQLCVHEVRGDKTTRELINADKITIAGIAAVTTVKNRGGKNTVEGGARKGKTLDLGKFRKGDKQKYKNKVVATIPLGPRAGEWPRDFQSWVLMVELDQGAVGKVVSAAVDAIDEKVVAAVSTAVASLAASVAAGSAIGSLLPLPGLGTALGAAAGAATAAVANALKNAKKDDVFPTRRARCSLDGYPRAAGEIAGSRKTLTFKGHGGVYKVVVSWVVK